MNTISYSGVRGGCAGDCRSVFKTVALVSCFGLAISLGLIVVGVDLGAVWL
jgi:hypothetical protein